MHFFFMRVLVASAALCLAFAPSVYAQSVNVIQPIRFGTWYITNNSSQHEVTVNTDDTSSHSPQLVPVRPPQKGIYQLTGLPISTPVTSINVTQGQALSGMGSEVITMNDFQVEADSSTDPSGALALTLGATARTSGSGFGYGRGMFTGLINVEINY